MARQDQRRDQASGRASPGRVESLVRFQLVGAVERPATRRGALVGLNGGAIWFLAVVSAAYTDGTTLPWRSLPDFFATARTVMATWLTTPGVTALELGAYAGLGMAIVGPAWFWVGRPHVERRWRDVGVSETSIDDTTAEPVPRDTRIDESPTPTAEQPEPESDDERLPDIFYEYEERWYHPDSEIYVLTVRTPDGERRYYKTIQGARDRLKREYD